MLVLTRKNNQSIIIGDEVEVKILGIAGEKVRIGISAPDDVSIFRDEVFNRMANGDDATEAAASVNGSAKAPTRES